LEQTSENKTEDIYGVRKVGQTFKTDSGTTIIKELSLKFEKIGNPPKKIDICISPLQQNGFPTQFPIQVKSISAVDIANGWNTVVFDEPAIVTPSTSYAIYAILPYGDKDNYIKWYISDANVYENGNFITCDDYHSTDWFASTEKDLVFKIYSENRVYACDADNLETVDFIGFAINNATMGEKITIQTDGIVRGFQNLSIGKKYYIQNTTGTIGITSGVFKKLVAVAVNEEELSIFWSDSVNKATLQEAIEGTNDTKMMTPKKAKDLISNSSINWNQLQNIPNGLSDGDHGIIYESDPTVNKLAKARLNCLDGQIVMFINDNWSCSDLMAGNNVTLVPSNKVKAKSDSEAKTRIQTDLDVFMTSLKSISIAFKGKIRVSYEYKCSTSVYNSNAQIYVDRKPAGILRTATTEWQISTEEISIGEGAKVQLYGKASRRYSTYVRNFRLMWDKKNFDKDYTIIQESPSFSK